MSALLSRKTIRESGPTLTLFDGISLPLARLHEAAGPARARFALWIAAKLDGPVLWIAPDWSGEVLNPCGVRALIDPARLLLVKAKRPDDILWCMEEALRAAAIRCVVADLQDFPNLTQVRRLHLAAERGAAGNGSQAPLGLLLTPQTGGAAGVETRWHIAPAHDDAPGQWHLSRLRARMKPPAAWCITKTEQQAYPQIKATIPVAV